MKVDLLFDREAAGNPYFYKIYHGIYDEIRYRHRNVQFTHVQPDYSQEGSCMSCPGGMSNFQLINPENNKSILLSFWDRGMNVFSSGHGWEKYNLVHYYGGLGMHMSSEDIYKNYGVKHTPLQYPLGVKDAALHIELAYNKKLRTKRKAVFIGSLYGTRGDIAAIMQKSDLVDIYSHGSYLGLDYFKKMNEYEMAISFNGNGEFCMRDVEAFGLGMPVVRSELKTQFFNTLIPNSYYIKGSEACPQACIYQGMNAKDIADSFISAIEENIGYPVMDFMGERMRDYYLKYCNSDYISKLFIDLVNINELN